MRQAAASLEDHPDPQPMREKAPSPDLDEASSDGLVAAGWARHEAKPSAFPEDTRLDGQGTVSGQRLHLDTLGAEDSEVGQAPDDRETEITAADVGTLSANVGLYVTGSLSSEASKSQASENTSGTEEWHGLADDPAEQGAPIQNVSVSEAALQSRGAGLEAIGEVASSNTPTERTAPSAEIPDASVSGDVSESRDAGFAALVPLTRSSAPIGRVGPAARTESSGIGTEQRPKPAIKNVPESESGSVAVDAPATASPIRPLVTGRETHFAPARPVVLEPFTGKSASAETKSPAKVLAEEPRAPAHRSVASPSRDNRPAKTIVPPVDSHVPLDDGRQSPGAGEGRTAPAPSTSDGRIASTPAVSDSATLAALPPGQLLRIADAVLASATGKPAPTSLDPAPSGISPSSQPLAQGAVRTLVIKLDPPDYGTLTIRIRLTGKTMAVQFHAARSETTRLLNHDRDKLSAAIETAGHDLDISIVGAAPNPVLPGPSTDQSWLPSPAGGSTGAQLANPENERRPEPPPARPFGDDRQSPHKDRDRDSHEAKPQDRRSGALYV